MMAMEIPMRKSWNLTGHLYIAMEIPMRIILQWIPMAVLESDEIPFLDHITLRLWVEIPIESDFSIKLDHIRSY